MEEKQGKSLKGRAWAIMLIVFLAGIAMAWAQNKVVPVIDIVQVQLNVGMSVAGWISSIFCVMGIVLALPAAGMMRKMGVKASGILALGATIIGTLIGIFAPNEVVLLISRVIEGFGLGLISVIAPAVISMWFRPEERGLPMGIWGAWQMVAQAGTFLFAGNILGLFGGDWKGLWWVGLILLIGSIVLYAIMVTKPPAEYNHADSEDTSVSMFEVFKYKSVWMMLFVSFFFCMACFGWCTWQASYWAEQGFVDMDTANSIIGWIYVAEMIIVVFEGALLDKIKRRRTFGIILGALYGILLFTAFTLTNNFAVTIVYAIIYPFLEGAICTVFWTITPQCTPKPQLAAAALSVLVIGMDCGMLIGAPFTGFMVETFGWAAASIEIGICGLLIALFYFLVKLYDENGNVIKS